MADPAKDVRSQRKIDGLLSESEEQFKQLVWHMQVGVLFLDRQSKILSCNPKAMELFGLTESQLIGRTSFHPDWNVIHEDGTSFLSSAFPVPQAIAGNRPVRNVIMGVYRPAMADRIWISVDAEPMSDEDGNVRNVVCTFIDITERKKIEDALRESEQKFRRLFQNHSAIKLLIDSETGDIVDANEAAANYYGWSLDELKHMKIYQINMFRNEDVKAGMERVLTEEKTHFEFRHQLKNGTIKEVDVYSNKIEINGKVYLHSIIHDITERKRAEEELKKKNIFIQTILDNLPIGVALNTIDKGDATYMNGKFEEIYGWPVGEIVDVDDFFRKVYPDDNYRKEIIEKVMADIQSGDPSKMHWEDCRVTHKDGSVHFVNAVNIPLVEQNTMVSTVFDITERKHMEEDLRKAKDKAEESDQLKTAFLHNISHEIRTPLNAIMGFSELLTRNNFDADKEKKIIDTILSSGVQLLNIVDDILAISRIEAGQEVITTKDVNVNFLGDQICSQFQLKAVKQHIDFKFNPGLPNNEAVISTDKTKLYQILSNLITNAFKFTSHGFIEFGYRTDHHSLVFYVRDSGIGIPTDMLDEIFKRFRQVEVTENKRYGGSGLGLSISKAYVELLGGKIWVTSTEKNGSTFYFTIPNQHTYVAPKAAESIIPDVETIIPKGLFILIAEDEESNYLLIEEMLSPFEPDILWAKDGAEAVEICKTNPKVQLILMDLKMPIMDGFEAARQIRSMFPTIPILAQSAYSTIEDINKAFDAGCNDLLSKPLNQHSLLLKINALANK